MIFINQVVILLLIALTSSSFSLKSSKRLVFLDQGFQFHYDDELGLMWAKGVWKLSDKKYDILPHVVKIECDKHKRSCTKSEISITLERDVFGLHLIPRTGTSYIVSDDVDFEITQWTNKRIIASYSGIRHTGEVSCFASTLTIDVLEKSVKIVSNPTSEYCKTFQGLGGYSVTGELVDGSNLYIETDSEMIWNQQK